MGLDLEKWAVKEKERRTGGLAGRIRKIHAGVDELIANVKAQADADAKALGINTSNKGAMERILAMRCAAAGIVEHVETPQALLEGDSDETQRVGESSASSGGGTEPANPEPQPAGGEGPRHQPGRKRKDGASN